MKANNLLDEMLAQVKLTKKTTAKEQKIIENATMLFATKGYANTSTSEIAKAAGVAEATIFRHYGTKENLLIAIVVPFLKDSIPALADDLFHAIQPQKQPTFAHFLKALILNRLAFIDENKEIFTVFIKELVYREDIRNQFVPFFRDEAFPRISGVIEYFKGKGQLKNIPNEIIFKTMLVNVLGHLVTQYILSPDPDRERTEKGIDLLVDTILYGIAEME